MGRYSDVKHKKLAIHPDFDAFLEAHFFRFDIGYSAHNFCLLIEMFDLKITEVAEVLGKTRKTIYLWRLEDAADKPSAKSWADFMDYISLRFFDVD